MNKKVIVAIIIVILILLGIAGYLLMGKGSNDKQTVVVPTQPQKTIQETAESVGQMFADAFEGNSSIKCTYKNEGNEGTIYIKNGLMKMETRSSGIQGNMIYKKPYVYTWQDGSKDGVKMDTSKTIPTGTQSQSYSRPEDVKESLDKYNANCVKENVSDVVFEIPASVTFNDVSELIKGVMEKVPTGFKIPNITGLPDASDTEE